GFHSDVVWLEDQRDYAVSLLGNLHQNLQILRIDAQYGVFLHELTYLKPYLDTHPEALREVREWIRQGRIGTGGSHSQPTETVIGGEGIIRNILYGRWYHEGVLGDQPWIYMPWDVFGHTAQLGQILRKSRFQGCIWSKDIRGALAVFWHLALDGEPLLFKRMGYWFPSEDPERFLKAIDDFFQEIRSLGFTADCRLDCVDFKPPTAWMVGRGEELAGREHAVILSGVGHEQWFEHAFRQHEEGTVSIPVTARDYEWHHQGTGLSRIELKIANRLAEHALYGAEFFATVAHLLGAEYPDKALDKAWRQVLFNQHHDGIAGPSCDRAFLDMMAGYREALELAHDVRTRSLRYLCDQTDTAYTAPPPTVIVLQIHNALGWSRTDAVRVVLRFPKEVSGFRIEDSEGNVVPCQLEAPLPPRLPLREAEVTLLARDIPPFGFRTYRVVETATLPPAPQPIPGYTIENEFFRVTADPTLGGGLSSIYDKQAGREVLNLQAGPGNEIVALLEKADRPEPAWECYTLGPKWFSREYAASVQAFQGAVQSRLVIRGEMRSCEREQTVSLTQGVRRIDFATQLQRYRGEHELFVVTFPVAVQNAEPVFEERFGAITKRKSKGKLDFRFHQWRNFSECGARHACQWIDLSGAAWIQFADGQRRPFGMCHLVTSHHPASVQAAYTLQRALIRKGVPCTPVYDDFDAPRRLELPVEDTLLPLPHNPNEDLSLGMSFRVAFSLNGDNTYLTELMARLPQPQADRLRTVLEEGGVVLLEDPYMPDGWQPLPVLVVAAPDEQSLHEHVQTLAKQLEETACIHLPAEANLVERSLPADDYGVALVNTGNVLNSVEHDNTIVLFLMHTAAWGYTPWGQPDRLPFVFIPEHKTHLFRYSLYPHAGDWRRAEVARVGWEVNNPLQTVQGMLHGGALPLDYSFLQVDARQAIVTAVKPGDNPTGRFESHPVDAEGKGIIVRLYDPTGFGDRVRLRWHTGIVEAQHANLLEEPQETLPLLEDGSVQAEIGSFAIETLLLKPKPFTPKGGRRMLGAIAEPIQPVYVRYWQHNLGADPMGYLPVAVSLRGEVKTGIHIAQGGVTVNTVEVGVVNNLRDRRAAGVVRLVVPEGWHTVPAEIPFDLPPGEAQVWKALLCFDTPRRTGVVRAQLDWDGQTYEDILEVGREYFPEWDIHVERNALVVHLHNPTDDLIRGMVQVITPLETWGEAVGMYRLTSLRGHTRGFELPPEGRARVCFEGEPPPGGGFILVKVMAHGKVEYR
ncbi:MAG: glycoside hydrolase family 38 C-terminal domain-containing protein, partial [Armatimonadota bacterium]|nr:glycoside hydrolase family 38 C-terminal domain-containing protein [Armatimonadota bacterium]